LHGYGPLPRRLAPASAATDLLLTIHIKKRGIELRLFTTIMTLGTPQDVTLQELRLETFFPADEKSEQQWKRIVEPH